MLMILWHGLSSGMQLSTRRSRTRASGIKFRINSRPLEDSTVVAPALPCRQFKFKGCLSSLVAVKTLELRYFTDTSLRSVAMSFIYPLRLEACGFAFDAAAVVVSAVGFAAALSPWILQMA